MHQLMMIRLNECFHKNAVKYGRHQASRTYLYYFCGNSVQQCASFFGKNEIFTQVYSKTGENWRNGVLSHIKNYKEGP